MPLSLPGPTSPTGRLVPALRDISAQLKLIPTSTYPKKYGFLLNTQNTQFAYVESCVAFINSQGKSDFDPIFLPLTSEVLEKWNQRQCCFLVPLKKFGIWEIQDDRKQFPAKYRVLINVVVKVQLI